MTWYRRPFGQENGFRKKKTHITAFLGDKKFRHHLFFGGPGSQTVGQLLEYFCQLWGVRVQTSYVKVVVNSFFSGKNKLCAHGRLRVATFQSHIIQGVP